MNKINFKKEKIPFTQVSNEVLYDKSLSFKAKGIYAYLYSKPDDWDFAIDRISKETKEGRKGVNSGLKELEENGYLERNKTKTGRMLYLLKSQMPQIDIREEKPDAPKGKVPKGQSAERGTISNTDIKVIKSISNKDSEQSSQARKLTKIQLFVEELKPLNEVAYTKWFGNKTQMKNIKLLMKQFTKQQMNKLIAFIVLNKYKTYFPSITTPLQLVDKLPQVEKFYKSKGYKKPVTETIGL